MPLAKSGSAASSSGATGSEPPSKKAAKPDRQAATIENLRRQVENLKRKPENQGGGAKRQKDAKGRAQKGQDRGGPMPAELKGHLSSIVNGPICFRFNLKEVCGDASTGQRCRRGWHHCCHRDCADRESHSLRNCPRVR